MATRSNVVLRKDGCLLGRWIDSVLVPRLVRPEKLGVPVSVAGFK